MAHTWSPLSTRSSSCGWLLVALYSLTIYCSFALVPLISVKKYDVTGKRITFYLQTKEKKDNSFPCRGSCSSIQFLKVGLRAYLCVKGWQSKQVIYRLWPLCCTEPSHGTSVIPAAGPGILACRDLKRIEKAAEIWVTEELQWSHRKSVHRSSSAQPVPCLLFCIFCVSYSASPHRNQQSILSIHVSWLPLHQLFCAKLFCTASFTGAVSYFCILPSATVFASPLVLHQLFCTTIYPRQQSHTLLILFWLLASCLRLCWFSRNLEERWIIFSFPGSEVCGAVLSLSSPEHSTGAVGWLKVYLTARHCRI